MGLDDLIRASVQLASTTFQPAKSRVQHVTWTGQDGMGAPSTVVVVRWPMLALRRMKHRMANGQEVEVMGSLTFLEPVPPNGAPGRVEPVDVHDRFILPDGTKPPVVDVIGPHDQVQGRPYYVKVWLGVG